MTAQHSVGFWEALRFWLKLGFISFGGPAGQIAVMHKELVVEKRWISEQRFLHALNYCMLLPGPEARQPGVNSAVLHCSVMQARVAFSFFYFWFSVPGGREARL